MDNNNLSFEIESEVLGINTFKDAIDLFEKDVTIDHKPSKEESLWIDHVIKCLRDFDETRKLESMSNIKASFMNGLLEVKYIETEKDLYMVCFFIVKDGEYPDYSILICRGANTLFEISTSIYEKTYSILSRKEYEILRHLDLNDVHYLCRDNGSCPYIMRSKKHPLKNSDLDSDTTPNMWISDVDGYDKKMIFKGEVFEFVNFFNGFCYDKTMIDNLISEYESHVTKVVI